MFVKVLEKSAKGEIYTIGKEDRQHRCMKRLASHSSLCPYTFLCQEFDELLQPYNKYPVVKRICPSCAATHTASRLGAYSY